MHALVGKAALLVGARRIGQVVARRLASEGMDIAIAYRSSRDEAEALRQDIEGMGRRSCLVQGDVGVEADVQRMVDEASKQMDGLWAMVNLASGFPHTPFNTLDGRAWDEAMGAAKGTYLLALAAARRFMENDGPTRGHIVLFGDVAAGEAPYRGYLPYVTAKAAIQFMTRAFAVELGRHGILVNAIAPGPTMRPPDVSEEAWERRIVGKTPLGRQSSAEDIAEVVATLLKCDTITGEVIRVDSGQHLQGA